MSALKCHIESDDCLLDPRLIDPFFLCDAARRPWRSRVTPPCGLTTSAGAHKSRIYLPQSSLNKRVLETREVDMWMALVRLFTILFVFTLAACERKEVASQEEKRGTRSSQVSWPSSPCGAHRRNGHSLRRWRMSSDLHGCMRG